MDPEAIEGAGQEGQGTDDDFAAGLADSPLTAAPAVQLQPTESEPEAKEPSDLEKLMLRAAELEGMTQKQFDKAFGTIGALTQKVTDLQARGGSIDLSPAKFKRLKELGFDDLTEALAGDLAEAIGTATPGSGGGIDRAALEDQIRENVRKEVQLDLLDSAHEGWRDEIATPEFQAYVASQPAEWQTEFNTTWKAGVVVKALRGFAAQRAAATPRTPAPPAPRSRRIESAVTPSGSGGSGGPIAKDPFLEGLGLA